MSDIWIAGGPANSNDGAVLAYSPDGLDWFDIVGTPLDNGRVNAIAYHGGVWVAVGSVSPFGSGAGIVMVSPDGFTWTQTLSLAGGCTAVAFAGTRWVVGTNEIVNPVIYTSVDAGQHTPWSPEGTWDGATTINGLYYNGTYLVAGVTDRAGKSVYYSADHGITWTVSTTPFDGGDGGVPGYSPTLDLWVMPGFDTSGTEAIMTAPSSGLLSGWTYRSSPLDNISGGAIGNCSAWDGTQFVVGGLNNANHSIVTSPDGITWTNRPNPIGTAGSAVEGVAYSSPRSQWVAVGEVDNLGSKAAEFSPDGATWTASHTTMFDGDFGLLCVAFGVGPPVVPINAHGAGYASPITPKPQQAGFGSGHAGVFGLAVPTGGTTPLTPGFAYLRRPRTARAVATVIPPVATGGLTIAPIPLIREFYDPPVIKNGLSYNSDGTPWAPFEVLRGTWAKQLQILIAGQDMTFFRGVPNLVTDWSSQDPFGDASASITFPAITSFDGLYVPPAIGIGPVVGVAGTYTDGGYWQATASGIVTPYGDASFFGDALGLLNAPISGIAAHPSQYGYNLCAQDGGIFSFGACTFEGSLPGDHVTPAKPVIAIANTASGKGYWAVGADGGIFAFGDARSFTPSALNPGARAVGVARSPRFDSTGLSVATISGGHVVNQSPSTIFLDADATAVPVGGGALEISGSVIYYTSVSGAAINGCTVNRGSVTLTASAAVAVQGGVDSVGTHHDGIIILADDGAVYAYGNAVYHGGFEPYLIAPYVAIGTAQGVDGYTAINSLGDIYALGADSFYPWPGSGVPPPLRLPANSISLTNADLGYWINAADGGIFAFGDAPFLGSVPSGGLPNAGSLSWLRLGSPVTINWIDPADVVHTLFEGVVADFEEPGTAGLVAQIQGVIFQGDWYLAKPIVNLPFVGYDPTQGTPIFGWDVGTAIAAALNSLANPDPGTAIGGGPVPSSRGGPYTGNVCAPVTTGILTVQRGSWDKLISSYVQSILSQASNSSGTQWTVNLKRPRTPVIELKNTTGINWTVWTGGHGVAPQLSLDQSTPADVIYGTGTAPTTFSTVGEVNGQPTLGSSASWANSKYPKLPPPLPTFPLGDGAAFAPGDGQTGLLPFTNWMRACGYPMLSADTYLATNVAANVLDQVLVEQYQIVAGLEVTGAVDASTWDAAFGAGQTAGATTNVYYQPLWELPEVAPYIYNPSGDIVGDNPFYNPRIPRVERHEAMGQNVNKAQGMLSASLEGSRTQAPTWQGTIVLTQDPEEGSRFEIVANQNVLLRAFHGRDVLLHISRAEADFTPQAMSVTLTVSEVATDNMTLAAIIARDTQAHGVQRAGRPSLVSLNVTSSVVTFDSESSAGYVGATPCPAGEWTVVRVPFSEYGSVAETNFQATGDETAFAMAVFSGPVTGSQVSAAFSGFSPLSNVDGNNPWNTYAQALDTLGLLYGAGGPNGPCGFWPSDPVGTQTLTGKYVDTATWTYAPAPGYVPYLWVAFYPFLATVIQGRFLVAPPPGA